MRNQLVVLFYLLATSMYAPAQTTFQKAYSFGGSGFEQGNSVQQTSDGGFIVTGSISSHRPSDVDVCLIKTDSIGDTTWTKAYGGSGVDIGYFVRQTTDGGFIVCGVVESFGTGLMDIFLLKTNGSGDTLWTRTYGGSAIDVGSCVQQTNDGGFIIAGITESFGAGNRDIILIRTDANGDTLWTKTYGGTGHDGCRSVQQAFDGGYIIGGGTSTFGAGDDDAYLIKTDSLGDTLWTKTYGGTGSDDARAVWQTNDGGYIICGSTTSYGAGNYDAYLIKTDINGAIQWMKTYGGSNSEWGYSVQQTTDNGFIMAGMARSFSLLDNVYLIKTNSNGDTLWTKVIGGANNDGVCYSIQQTSDGGYISTGYTYNAGNFNVYLIKTDSLSNSGCNEERTSTTLTTPATLVSNTATMVGFPNTDVSIPGAVVGSGGTINTICTTLGINDFISDSQFRIYPNPNKGIFTISFGISIERGVVKVFNALGESVFSDNILNESKKEIRLICVSSGIYFVNIYDNDKIYFKKLIVE